MHEGGERALFAVLDGRIEVVKSVDGIERVLGDRLPGIIFGEVPIALGTVFPGGFRAAERVARSCGIEAHDYYAIAAAVARRRQGGGRARAHRMGGRAGCRASPPSRRRRARSSSGIARDAACTELRRFLDRNQITFRGSRPTRPTPPSSGAAAAGRRRLAGDPRSGGTTLVRPRLRAGRPSSSASAPRPTPPSTTRSIIGGGPAGLAAAVYGASEGLRTIVIEREAPGGQAGTSSRIENYLGFPAGVSGDELASRALQQARRLGAEILVTRTITRIDPATARAPRRRRRPAGADDHPRHRRDWRRLAIDGFDRLIGKGIYYGAARSEAATHARPRRPPHRCRQLGRAGGDVLRQPRAHRDARRARRRAREEHVAVPDRPDRERSRTSRSRSAPRSSAVHGEGSLSAIDLRRPRDRRDPRHECGGLFIFIGADAETGWLPPEIALDARGYVLTGADVRDGGPLGARAATRTCSRRACPASSPAATCASAR